MSPVAVPVALPTLRPRPRSQGISATEAQTTLYAHRGQQ
jgi:hypothetical protein